MSNIRYKLEKQYQNLFTVYGLEKPFELKKNISLMIKHSLNMFLKDARKPAMYCNGKHTRMLMADFIFELKKIKYIVDNYALLEENNGFTLIRDEEIETYRIDAIVLSTFDFRKELKENLKKEHPDIPVLDIYDEFEKEKMIFQLPYYYASHPHLQYQRINQLQRQIKEKKDGEAVSGYYLKLVTQYIHIKDFRTAIIKLKAWINDAETEKKDSAWIKKLLLDVEKLYILQKKAASSLRETHVLMLCLDGLRRGDLSDQKMPKLKKLFDETGYQFTNAYSFSTSTFESLVPVYEENGDLRTKYYERSSVDSKNCRFASLAKEQERDIYIYGDGVHYIEDKGIHYMEQFFTATEKLWYFILDACSTESGLFYVHELYESHFSFANPYTESELRSEGTAMLFDFLPAKGGRLRCDYAQQHKDAIRYLDDIMEPLIRPMKCRMLIFADHGNLILDRDAKLSDVGDLEYTCSEGWSGIPLILRSPEMGTGKDGRLVSLMELNNMMISLFTKNKYEIPEKEYIKMARSEIYNPDFKLLYRMAGKEKGLQAFECFLFTDGRRLMVYADGTVEMYDEEESPVYDIDVQAVIRKVEKDITVYEISEKTELVEHERNTDIC